MCYALSKILEQLMYNWLISLVSIKNILTQAQNGFTEKTSTEKGIRSFTESIQNVTDGDINHLIYFLI
jgi:hypothetical protein